METLNVSIDNHIGKITLKRGKANAINETMVDQIHDQFLSFEKNPTIKSVILTANGNFFSFGFDVPKFMGYSKERFIQFLIKFCDLCHYLFVYPKALTAALNGHTIAGGCLLALAADYRIMV